MFSPWLVAKLAARKGHTIKSRIGTAATGRRITLSDAEGNDVSAGAGKWGFTLEAAAAYLERLPDVPESRRPSLVADDEAVVQEPTPARRPSSPAKTFTAKDLVRGLRKA